MKKCGVSRNSSIYFCEIGPAGKTGIWFLEKVVKTLVTKLKSEKILPQNQSEKSHHLGTWQVFMKVRHFTTNTAARNCSQPSNSIFVNIYLHIMVNYTFWKKSTFSRSWYFFFEKCIFVNVEFNIKYCVTLGKDCTYLCNFP